MTSNTFEVTLMWHDGGSVFLGTARAANATEACNIALTNYKRDPKNLAEIETGGGYQLEAERI